MINNFRFEISFKNFDQLEKKIQFCLANNLYKINIPCKGVIKKDFFNETISFISKNYKELDVIYHYSLFHQYSKSIKISYLKLLYFIKINNLHNKEILLISGSTKKKEFQVIDVLKNLSNERDINIDIGVAYNPYLIKHYDISGEDEKLIKKISSGLTKSIWLQFGTDLKLLESKIIFLKQLKKSNDNNLKLFGSILIPSKQFIARFKLDRERGFYLEKYLSSLDNFIFTKDLINCILKMIFAQ